MDDASSSIAEQQKFSLNIHELIRQLHNENGLKHNDHTRYRHFLTKRMRRVRKSLGMTHGKGKAFVKIDIIPEIVANSSFLLLALLSTERAWSYAEEYKDSFSKTSEMQARHKELKKHAKASILAKKFEVLCLACGDLLTGLEASAYAHWMYGQNCLERENWETAVEYFTTSKSIYGELCKVGRLDQQDLFSERLQQLEPSLRFCRYNFYGPGSENINDESFNSANPDIVAKLNLIRAKQISLSAESNLDAQNGNLNGRVTWGDRIIVPPTDELVGLCIQIKSLLQNLDSSEMKNNNPNSIIVNVESKQLTKEQDAIYERLLHVIDNTYSVIVNDISKLSAGIGGKLGETKVVLSNLKNYVQYVRMIVIRHRLNLLVEKYERSYLAEALMLSGNNTPHVISPQDVAHLYEKLLLTTKEILTIPGKSTAVYCRSA